MPVILYLGTGSAYIKLKGLFMLSTNKIQGIFQYLPQFKIYFSRTFRLCIITFRFVFNYTSVPLYSQICIGPECEGTNMKSGSQIGGSFKPWLKVGGKLSKKKLTSKKRSYDFNILPKKWEQQFSFALPFQFQNEGKSPQFLRAW